LKPPTPFSLTRSKRMELTTVILSFLLIAVPISAITLKEGIPTRSIDVCDGCHGGKYDLVLSDPVLTSPSFLHVGEAGQVTISISITADGNSDYYLFDLSVALVSLNSRISTPSPVTFSGQRPSASGGSYVWSREIILDIDAVSRGTDTLRADATIDPHHEVGPRTRSSTFSLTVNDPPSLSSGTHSPGTGDTSTSFTFTVDYSDKNGDLPSFIHLILDGTSYPLSASDGAADTIVSGETYGTSMVLPAGNHSYHFEASDGINTTMFPEEGGDVQGPVVTQANRPPVLSEPMVDPSTGNCSTLFTFSVTYTDEDDDPPIGGIRLLLNGTVVERQMTVITGPPSPLNDGVFINGERYHLKMSLPCGAHRFEFNATDGSGWAASERVDGPIVSEIPFLLVSIEQPEEGEIFYSGSVLTFSASYISNVDLPDAVFSWSSSISGELGEGNPLLTAISPGEHLLTVAVRSTSLGLLSRDFVNITVLDPGKIPLMLEMDPASDITIREGETVHFSVVLDMDHPFIVEAEDLSMRFLLDGMEVHEGNEWNYSTSFEDQGLHGVEFLVYGDLDLILHKIWNITVTDVKASIILGDIPDANLGAFRKGDIIKVSIEAGDPMNRTIRIIWLIDNISTGELGDTFEWELRRGPWSREGNHILSALLTNTDGVSLRLNFTYTIIEENTDLEPPGGDENIDNNTSMTNTTLEDDGEDAGAGIFGSLKGDPVGISILAVGALLLLIGVVHSIFVLVRTPKSGAIKRNSEYQLSFEE